MVSTRLKNISQHWLFPQIGVKIKHIWNNHLVKYGSQGWVPFPLFTLDTCRNSATLPQANYQIPFTVGNLILVKSSSANPKVAQIGKDSGQTIIVLSPNHCNYCDSLLPNINRWKLSTRASLALKKSGCPDIVATVALAPKKAFLHLFQTLLSSDDSVLSWLVKLHPPSTSPEIRPLCSGLINHWFPQCTSVLETSICLVWCGFDIMSWMMEEQFGFGCFNESSMFSLWLW